MNENWNLILDIAYLSVLLGVVTVLKRVFDRLNKLLIPNSVLAGLLGLLLGPNLLKAIPFDFDRLGNLVYHLLAIGFIAIALKKRPKEASRSAVNTGFFIATSYALQGILGFVLGWFIITYFFPGLFTPFGFLLTLGFGQGPGMAYSMGKTWFEEGGTVGLTVATLGFLWAAVGGIILLNVMVYRKKQIGIKIKKPKVLKMVDVTVRDRESSDIDSFTVQILCIGVVYLITYLFLQSITGFLWGLGSFGQTFAQLLWGFHFVIAVGFAFLFRKIYDSVRKDKDVYNLEYLNDFHLQRIAGAVFDFMVTAAISAIAISVIKDYLIPVLVLTTVGGFWILGYVIFISKRIYKKYVLEHIITMFGMHTGTISTGMALLRELDPQFETGTAEDMVIGSGIALFTGFPALLIINIPIVGFKEGKPIMYLWTVVALLVYLGLLYFLWFRPASKRVRKFREEQGNINEE